MRKIAIFLMAAVLFMAMGCGASEKEKSKEEKQKNESSEQTEDVTMVAEEELEDGRYTWQEVTITLPSNWVGRCTIEEWEDGFTIYQSASYDSESGLGYICGLQRTTELMNLGMGEQMFACKEDGTFYYLMYPTDVPCDTENEEVSEEYFKMSSEAQLIGSAIEIEGVKCDAQEYIMPTSSLLLLKEEELAYLPDNVLWLAKNEIYARHGRQFNNDYLNRYFNRCSWYEGTIAPEAFDEKLLTKLEKDNISMLSAAQEAYREKHPYPEKYSVKETVHLDLNGDGKPEDIVYQASEGAACKLTVNGIVWDVEELTGYVSDPILDHFYITDIDEEDGVREIAVLDQGPSEDPTTFFFRYEGDGTLFYMGQVSGFPFAEHNDGVNGFDYMGNIIGRTRMDLIETAYLEDLYRYDRATRWVRYDGSIFMHDMLPTQSHVLHEDLTVRFSMSEDSSKMVIPAQEQVFFLQSDMQQWILVKGKDGKKGYMLVKDGEIVDMGKPAEEVFSELRFFD